MKILLLGANGQVGWELQRSLAPLGNLVALGRTSRDGFCGDLTNIEALINTVRTLSPDVIVNAAAYTAVDKAETDQEVAQVVNAEAPAALAKESAALGALLVHYSTDYVFDGSGDQPWRESDTTSPLNVYGQTKLSGEKGIQDSKSRYLIFRTSWVFAARGQNFIHTMLRLAAQRESLSIVNDQTGAPTGSELIADVTAHAIRDAMRGEKNTGIYHLAAEGETTWHGYAKYVIQRASELGWALKAGAGQISGIPTQSFPTPAQRPLNSRLDCSKLVRAFDLQLPQWQTGVDRVLDELQMTRVDSQ